MSLISGKGIPFTASPWACAVGIAPALYFAFLKMPDNLFLIYLCLPG